MPTADPTSLTIQSPLLSRAGYVHGFSSRVGGCSKGDFASLNLGGSVGDDRAAVEENHRRLAAYAGLERSSFRTASQVHGSRVIELDAWSPLAEEVEADALVAFFPGLAPAVRTADCVPILLAAPEEGWAAAIHAGWRGTRARIAAAAVQAIASRGAPPSSLIAAVGPAIQACCYEVSAELAADFAAGWGEGVADGRMLDLPEINRRILLDAGLSPDAVEVLPSCTSCEPSRFFSHRRDAGRTGRQLSFIQSR